MRCSFLVKQFGDGRSHAAEVRKSVGGMRRVDHRRTDDALPFLRRIDSDLGLVEAESCPPSVGWTYHACP